MLSFRYSRPGNLLGIGVISFIAGIILIKRAWEGDTLIPGTLTCYVPKWIYYLGGTLLLFPFPLAYYFLKSQGRI